MEIGLNPGVGVGETFAKGNDLMGGEPMAKGCRHFLSPMVRGRRGMVCCKKSPGLLTYNLTLPETAVDEGIAGLGPMMTTHASI